MPDLTEPQLPESTNPFTPDFIAKIVQRAHEHSALIEEDGIAFRARALALVRAFAAAEALDAGRAALLERMAGAELDRSAGRPIAGLWPETYSGEWPLRGRHLVDLTGCLIR
jgi:hypothetical protein